MRDLILSGGPYSEDEKTAILNYCEEDVSSLVQLLHEMVPDIELNHAFYRGEYSVCLSKIEARGIPIDRHFTDKVLGQYC